MSTPYITPSLLLQADTGIDWGTIVFPDSNTTQTTAEINNICWRATELADLYCNQILRATTDTEIVNAPGDRAWIQNSGETRVWLSRWPILSIVSLNVSTQRFPTNFQPLASTLYEVRQQMSLSTGSSGTGAYTISIAPGIISFLGGREAYEIQIQYINGWPHTSLTGTTAPGATSLPVDDCTGFAGASFTIYDGADTEIVNCTASSAVSGAGTLTLSPAAMFGHEQGVLTTAIPSAIQQACIYLATDIALTRGTTALALPSAEHVAGTKSMDYQLEAYSLLAAFRRIF